MSLVLCRAHSFLSQFYSCGLLREGWLFVLRHYRHWSLVAAEVIADRSKPYQTESPKSRVTSGASMQCRERTVSLRKIDADFLYGVVDRLANLFQNLHVESHAEATHAIGLEVGAFHAMRALDVERNDAHQFAIAIDTIHEIFCMFTQCAVGLGSERIQTAQGNQ